MTGEADEDITRAALDLFNAIRPISRVIEMGGRTAELHARFWAEDHNVEVVTVRAGTPIQSAVEALKLKPSYVLAFPWYSVALADRAMRKGIQVGYAEIKNAAVDAGRDLSVEENDRE